MNSLRFLVRHCLDDNAWGMIEVFSQASYGEVVKEVLTKSGQFSAIDGLLVESYDPQFLDWVEAKNMSDLTASRRLRVVFAQARVPPVQPVNSTAAPAEEAPEIIKTKDAVKSLDGASAPSPPSREAPAPPPTPAPVAPAQQAATSPTGDASAAVLTATPSPADLVPAMPPVIPPGHQGVIPTPPAPQPTVLLPRPPVAHHAPAGAPMQSLVPLYGYPPMAPQQPRPYPMHRGHHAMMMSPAPMPYPMAPRFAPVPMQPVPMQFVPMQPVPMLQPQFQQPLQHQSPVQHAQVQEPGKEEEQERFGHDRVPKPEVPQHEAASAPPSPPMVSPSPESNVNNVCGVLSPGKHDAGSGSDDDSSSSSSSVAPEVKLPEEVDSADEDVDFRIPVGERKSPGDHTSGDSHQAALEEPPAQANNVATVTGAPYSLPPVSDASREKIRLEDVDELLAVDVLRKRFVKDGKWPTQAAMSKLLEQKPDFKNQPKKINPLWQALEQKGIIMIFKKGIITHIALRGPYVAVEDKPMDGLSKDLFVAVTTISDFKRTFGWWPTESDFTRAVTGFDGVKKKKKLVASLKTWGIVEENHEKNLLVLTEAFATASHAHEPNTSSECGSIDEGEDDSWCSTQKRARDDATGEDDLETPPDPDDALAQRCARKEDHSPSADASRARIPPDGDEEALLSGLNSDEAAAVRFVLKHYRSNSNTWPTKSEVNKSMRKRDKKFHQYQSLLDRVWDSLLEKGIMRVDEQDDARKSEVSLLGKYLDLAASATPIARNTGSLNEDQVTAVKTISEFHKTFGWWPTRSDFVVALRRGNARIDGSNKKLFASLQTAGVVEENHEKQLLMLTEAFATASHAYSPSESPECGFVKEFNDGDPPSTSKRLRDDDAAQDDAQTVSDPDDALAQRRARKENHSPTDDARGIQTPPDDEEALLSGLNSDEAAAVTIIANYYVSDGKTWPTNRRVNKGLVKHDAKFEEYTSLCTQVRDSLVDKGIVGVDANARVSLIGKYINLAVSRPISIPSSQAQLQDQAVAVNIITEFHRMYGGWPSMSDVMLALRRGHPKFKCKKVAQTLLSSLKKSGVIARESNLAVLNEQLAAASHEPEPSISSMCGRMVQQAARIDDDAHSSTTKRLRDDDTPDDDAETAPDQDALDQRRSRKEDQLPASVRVPHSDPGTLPPAEREDRRVPPDDEEALLSRLCSDEAAAVKAIIRSFVDNSGTWPIRSAVNNTLKTHAAKFKDFPSLLERVWGSLEKKKVVTGAKSKRRVSLLGEYLDLAKMKAAAASKSSKDIQALDVPIDVAGGGNGRPLSNRERVLKGLKGIARRVVTDVLHCFIKNGKWANKRDVASKYRRHRNFDKVWASLDGIVKMKRLPFGGTFVALVGHRKALAVAARAEATSNAPTYHRFEDSRSDPQKEARTILSGHHQRLAVAKDHKTPTHLRFDDSSSEDGEDEGGSPRSNCVSHGDAVDLQNLEDGEESADAMIAGSSSDDDGSTGDKSSEYDDDDDERSPCVFV